MHVKACTCLLAISPLKAWRKKHDQSWIRHDRYLQRRQGIRTCMKVWAPPKILIDTYKVIVQRHVHVIPYKSKSFWSTHSVRSAQNLWWQLQEKNTYLGQSLTSSTSSGRDLIWSMYVVTFLIKYDNFQIHYNNKLIHKSGL